MASLNMVLRRMGVELILTRVTQHSIRRLLAAHGIIAPSAVASSTPAAATSGDVEEQQQPLLTQAREEQQQQEEEEGGFCRVFDTLNEGAKHAEDRCACVCWCFRVRHHRLYSLG
jgi:ribosomal protein L12E/L44/L45/RPP1/RPP2